MDRQQEFVLRTIEERDIRFIRLWFTDVVGTLKSVALAPAEVESAFDEGLGFDGSSIEGFSRIYESDMLLQPDPSTFQILPWRGEEDYTSRMFCDVLTPDGEISASDTRGVLKRVLNKAAEMGFTCYTSPEIEFYLLESSKLGADGFPVPVDYESYFDHTPGGIVQDFRRKAVTMLEEVGISVEFSHHETGPGQNEIDLRHADALQTADNVMTFRTVIKEVAYSLGMYATFMPKPFTKYAGSGMHTHFSLFEGDINAFHDPDAEFSLSRTGQQFIADFHFRTRIDKGEVLDRCGTNHLGVRTHVFPRRVGKIVHLEGRLFAVFFIDERHFFFTAHCLFDLRTKTVAGEVHQREIVQRIERHTDHVDQRKERKQPLCVA